MAETSSIWQALLSEFSDMGDLRQATIILLRLGLAVILGAAIGYERERKGKDAGLRTHILVSMGAALFVMVPALSDMDEASTSRVIQGVVSGIGFLGAGAIIKQQADQEVKGLTTAATIWVAAAIGVAAGYGKEATAIASTLIALFVLTILRRWER